MESWKILHLLEEHAPLDAVALIHTFKGSVEGNIRDITIEVREWNEGAKQRYHIRATTEQGKQVFGTNAYDSVEIAIQVFPWYEVEQAVADEEPPPS